jgi:uncharacterized integral membrane protein
MTEERPIRDIDEMMSPEPRSAISAGAVIALIAAALFIVFVAQNLEPTSITYLGFDFEAPVWLVSLIVFVLGWIVGYFMKTMRVRRQRRETAARMG